MVVFLCVGPIGVGRRRAGLGPGDDDALLQSHRRDEKFVSWGRPCPASRLPYRGAVGPAGEAGSHHARPRKPGRAAETCSHVGVGSVTAHLVHSELCGAEPEPAKGQARAETEERESGARVGDPGQQQLPGRRRAAEGAACGDLEVLSLELALQPRTDTVRPKEEPSKVGAGPVEAHSFDVRAKC